jgi:hypothetical protein
MFRKTSRARASRAVWSSLFLGLLVGAAGRAEAALLYGADGQNGNPATNLYILDPATGARIATVGPIGFAVTGLAFNPITGVLYGDSAPHGSPARQLITINPATGAGTLVGPMGVTMDDIAFDRNGTLYGWSGRASGSSLYTINTTTGAATRVGTSGITDLGVGFAIDSTGTPILAARGAGGPLSTVNKATGAVTNLATLSGAPIPTGSIDALAFDPSGTLFGINLAEGGPGSSAGAPGNTSLVTVNPTTGAITTLGPSLPGLDAIVFQLVPEPSSLALMTVGSIGVLGYAWRRRRAG